VTVAWFVDGSYAYSCWRSVAGGRNLDYTRFRTAVEEHAQDRVTDAYYFNAEDEDPSPGQQGFHSAIQAPPPYGPGLRVKLGSLQTRAFYWPESWGGGAVVHPATGHQLEQRFQKEVDVLLAFNLMRSYAKRGWQKLYLVAGDKDFFEVVRYLVEDEGVDVTMFGVRNSGRGTPSVASKYGPYVDVIFFEDHIDDLALAPEGLRANA
jgi:uncharacterized LabA/DUF88 family protein